MYLRGVEFLASVLGFCAFEDVGFYGTEFFGCRILGFPVWL